VRRPNTRSALLARRRESIKFDTRLRVASLIARARARTGLTQAAFAEASATSRTRLSAYERGHTSPELDTLERIVAAASLELMLVPRGTARFHDQISALRNATVDDDRAWALRLVAELVAWVRSDVIDVEALASDPGSVGDRPWDALVGGVVEMPCQERAMVVPAWTSAPSRFCNDIWFVSPLRRLWPTIFQSTPASLAARGVFLSAESLTGL
jgi:transcriptional regulator with XRE-family HTH domain